MNRLLDVLGSLRLTVALLGMSVFLVFAGTLAQVRSGIWTVMEQYFRCWIAWVDLHAFQARSGAPSPLGIPFPGGFLLGAALIVNLVVSHARRIRLEARGRRLALGLAVTALGVALTAYAIGRVADADSSRGRLDPFWRVTAQLLQGVGVAVVLFAGCRLLFGRKAGLALLHGGVVLLMFGELVTARIADEGVMTIEEGSSSNFVEDRRECELAFWRPDPGGDLVVAVPRSRLVPGARIPLPELPIDVEVLRFHRNAELVRTRGDGAPATSGAGRGWAAMPRPEESGGRTDQPAAYVALLDRTTRSSLGAWLVAVPLEHSPEGRQTVEVGGVSVSMALRFKRTYKPYALHLFDFRFERYVGTNMPKDFSSFVRLTDRERGVEREARIWMNNPLRYRGDTLYQASFDRATETTTVLQVVSNAGWMLPYIGCMIVAAGLLGQFSTGLLSYLRGRRGTP